MNYDDDEILDLEEESSRDEPQVNRTLKAALAPSDEGILELLEIPDARAESAAPNEDSSKDEVLSIASITTRAQRN